MMQASSMACDNASHSFGFDLRDDPADRGGDGRPHRLVRDELVDVGELDLLPIGQLHPVLRLLAGDLHEARDRDGQTSARSARTGAPSGPPGPGARRARPEAGGSVGRLLARGRSRGALWRSQAGRRRRRKRARTDGRRRRAPARALFGLGDGPLEVIQPVARLEAVGLAVVADQVHDLLLRQTGVDAEARQRQIVPGLALVLEVVTLAVPGVPELACPRASTRRASPAGCAAFGSIDQRLVREPLLPLARRALLLLRVGNLRVVQELLEVGEVVEAIRLAENRHVLRVGRVLVVLRARNPEDARQIGEPVVHPAAAPPT